MLTFDVSKCFVSPTPQFFFTTCQNAPGRICCCGLDFFFEHYTRIPAVSLLLFTWSPSHLLFKVEFRAGLNSFLPPRGSLPQIASSPGFKSALEGFLNSPALIFPIAVPAFLSGSLYDWVCHCGPNTSDSCPSWYYPRVLGLLSLSMPALKCTEQDRLPPAWREQGNWECRLHQKFMSGQAVSLGVESKISCCPYSIITSTNQTYSLCPPTCEAKRMGQVVCFVFVFVFLYQTDILIQVNEF